MSRIAKIKSWLDKPTTNVEIILGHVAIVLIAVATIWAATVWM